MWTKVTQSQDNAFTWEKQWNKLPKEVMQTPSLEVFKTQLDTAKSNLVWSFIWPWFEYKVS